MVPLIQKELDIFRETVWNSHRIRAQRDTALSDAGSEINFFIQAPSGD